MRLYIFRNHTVEPLFHGLDVSFSGYEDISSIDQEADAFLWFYTFPVRSDMKALAEEIESYFGRIALVSERVAGKAFYMMTLCSIDAPRWLDGDFSVSAAIDAYNRRIVELSERTPNARVLDIREFLSRFGSAGVIDWKYYYISQMPINPRLVAPFREWLDARLQAAISARKKCIVLDLDNTLWGGILGEDGLDKIQIGNGYPGNAFSDFQAELAQAKAHGVILALCSKNDEAEVLLALQSHPALILRREDFAAARINWNDKATNILELAEELNIGLDSMVFLDDNPAERELVAKALPEVVVPDFPGKPYEIPSFFRGLYARYFALYALTDEDRKKTEQYKANALRSAYSRAFGSFEEYLANLGMELSVQYSRGASASRIAQLSQKTNQFNLTTHRYTEDEVRRLIVEGHLVATLSVKDKFGDQGLTGCCIVRVDGDKRTGSIEALMLSCRILGKGIEVAFASAVLNSLLVRGVLEVEALFARSPKNAQTEQFYEKLGFEVVERGEGTKRYRLRLERPLPIMGYYSLREVGSDA